MRTITIKLPKIEDITFTIECFPEDTSPRDNFALDCALEDNIIDDIMQDYENGNDWAWCMVKLTGQYRGFEGCDYLGCCSYKSEQDFIDNSGYYDDMKNVVYQMIINKLEFLSLN